MKDLVKLLPENMSDDGIETVLEWVKDRIDERVSVKEKNLSQKVETFIFENIDKLQKAAMVKAEKDSKLIRSAKLFETVVNLVAEEVLDEHIQQLLEAKESEIAELNEGISELSNYIESLEEENNLLKQALEGENVSESLEDSGELVNEAYEPDEEVISESSQKAVVITHNVDEVDSDEVYANEHLNEEVLRLALFNPNRGEKKNAR